MEERGGEMKRLEDALNEKRSTLTTIFNRMKKSLSARHHGRKDPSMEVHLGKKRKKNEAPKVFVGRKM